MRLPSPSITDPLASLAATARAVAIVGGGILLLWALATPLLLIFLAVLFGAMLRGLAVQLMRHTRLPYALSLAIVTLLVVVVIAGLSWWAGPRFVNEGQQLWKQLSGEFGNLRSTWIGKFVSDNFLGGSGKSSGGGLLSSAGSLATSTFAFLGALLVVVATALYFAIEPMMYVNGIAALFPMPYRPRAREVMIEIGRTLQWWLLGQFIDMVVVGVLAGIGLAMLGIPLAMVLAVIAGLFTFVPYFGPIVSAIPAIVVAMTVGVWDVVWVIVIYLACHAVEGYVVAPFVQRRTVLLPPALTVTAMLILSELFGALGLILATPFAAAVLVAVREGYVYGVLGDPAGHGGMHESTIGETKRS